jgi:hypothetical protein
MKRTGRVGQFCACAGAAAPMMSADTAMAAAIQDLIVVMFVVPQRLFGCAKR